MSQFASVVLKLRQTTSRPAKEGEQGDIFNRTPPSISCELLVDGKPLNALVQSIDVHVDAQSMLPKLTLSIVPTDIELDIDVEHAELLPVLSPFFALSKPMAMPGARLKDEKLMQELIAKYKQAFPGG